MVASLLSTLMVLTASIQMVTLNYLAVTESTTTTLTYTVDDGEGGTATASLTVTVQGVNDDPTTVGSVPNQNGNDGDTIGTIDTAAFFNDQDTSDALTYTAIGLPPGLTIDPNSGEISGTIDNSASVGGPYTVTVTANDGNGGTAQQTFSWTVNNPAPTATDNANSVTEDSSLTTAGNVISDNDGSGIDTDPDGDSLTVSAVDGIGASVGVALTSTFGDIVINSDGSYIYTLDNSNPTVAALDVGEILLETFDYTVNDGEGGSSTATLTITIIGSNDAPVAGGTIPAQNNLDSESISTLDTSVFFSDPDGDSLTFSASGLPTGLTINAVNGEISGTLDSSASQNAPGGVFSVTVTASDDQSQFVSQTFNWTVTNPGPVTGNDSFTTNEDTSFSGNVAANDNDPDGDTVTFAQNTGPSNGSLSFASDGSFTYTPDADFFGTDSFTYTITDADGATDTSTVTITINSVNDAPTVTPIADQTDQDSDVINFDVSGNFSDTENDTLTFSATGLPTGLSIDTNTGVISGTISSSASQSGPLHCDGDCR